MALDQILDPLLKFSTLLWILWKCVRSKSVWCVPPSLYDVTYMSQSSLQFWLTLATQITWNTASLEPPIIVVQIWPFYHPHPEDEEGNIFTDVSHSVHMDSIQWSSIQGAPCRNPTVLWLNPVTLLYSVWFIQGPPAMWGFTQKPSYPFSRVLFRNLPLPLYDGAPYSDTQLSW